MTPKPSNAKHAATYRARQAARVKRMEEALALIDGALSNERIVECKKAFAYKYFGDYEMSEGQREAVDEAETAMDVIAAIRQALAPQGEK